MTAKYLLDIVCCPACGSHPQPDPGQLDLIDDVWLVCRDCARKYPIRNGVAVLLVEEGDRHRHTPVEDLGKP